MRFNFRCKFYMNGFKLAQTISNSALMSKSFIVMGEFSV